jgi:hypothetical protein
VGDVLAAQRADQVLAAAYLDPRQRARAVKWLGWVACHVEAGETIEWWAIPSWMPAVKPLTVRRLAAWAVFSGMAGIGVGFTPWAAILFGITASSVLVQAAFVVVSESAAPVLPPGPPQAIAFRRLGWREVVKLPMSCILLAARAAVFLFRRCFWPPVIMPGTDPAAVRRAPWAGAGGGRAVTCRDAQVTSLLAAASGMLAGALLAALTLLPAYGSPGWLAATALFMLGTTAFAWLMAGRYPLLWLSGLMLGGPRLRFCRLLEDATDRQVLCRSGSGYVFRDDEVRAGLIALSRPGAAGAVSGKAGEASRTGIGARLSGLSSGTVHRIAADISIGIWVAFSVGIFIVGRTAGDPVWLPLLLAAGMAVGIWSQGYRVLRETLGGIVSGARWRQEHIAGLGPLRGIIAITIGGASAWMLIIAAGPNLAGILARTLPALFVAACGTWAWILAEGKTRHRWAAMTRRIADVLLVATTAATGLVLFKQGLLTAQPAAVLLFPPALWGAISIWRAMNSSRRLTVNAAADVTLSLLLGAELVIALVWLANLIGLPEAEMVKLRDAAQYAGSAASLPWWAWTGVYVLLAGAALAFTRWPGRLARQLRWFERLRLFPSTEFTRRVLTGAHVGLLVIVLAGSAAPAALAPTLHSQLKNAYMVAFQRNLEAAGELDAYNEIRSEFADMPADPVLTSIVTSIRNIDDPAPGSGATSTEADIARRVGEFQALALAVKVPPALRDSEQAAARAAGFDGPTDGVAALANRAGVVEREQHAGDEAARRAEAAGELAASAIASTLSIPNISSNGVFQIVWEYLSSLVEGSPLKDRLAAWEEHLPGGEAPQDAAQAVVPDAEELKAAASSALSEQYEVQGLEEPNAAGDPMDQVQQGDDSENWPFTDPEDDPDITAAVNMANQARWLQNGAGPCSPCVRPPRSGEEPGVIPGEDEHFSEP